MNKQQKILREEDFKVSKWSGGITKQLYIYPEHGDYPTRNFKFRISIATTQMEQSTFTKLHNVDRVISILKGKMELTHKGFYTKVLQPYHIDRFKGQWDTTSKGKVIDFNLMLKDCRGDFFFKQLKAQQTVNLENNAGVSFVYCICGVLIIENKSLKQGELLVTDEREIKIRVQAEGKFFHGFAEV